MYRRLLIARDLMSEDGVIFVSIDDNEMAHLRLLMDQVFPGMFVGIFVWKHRYASTSDVERHIGVDHEYILCYANSGFSFRGPAKSQELYANPDNDPRGPWQSADLRRGFTRLQRANLFYPLRDPGTDIWYPADPDQVWRYATKGRLKPGQKVRTQTMEEYIAQGRIIWPEEQRTARYESRAELDAAIAVGTAHPLLRPDVPDLDFWVGPTIGFGTPRLKRYWKELRRRDRPVSTWISNSQEPDAIEDRAVLASGFGQEGTRLLAEVLGKNDFDYPKPLSLITALIRYSTDPHDTVLDFFAGSGTTGHAVLAVNAEDDGDRRFILSLSTEATEDEPDKNLCRDVCRERVVRVMSGYEQRTGRGVQEIEGLGGTLAYLRLRKIPFARIGLDVSHGEVWTTLQLLHGLWVKPLDMNSSVQCRAWNSDAVVYVPELSQTTVDAVRSIASKQQHVTVYSWEAAVLRQHLVDVAADIRVQHIPKLLTDRFEVPR